MATIKRRSLHQGKEEIFDEEHAQRRSSPPSKGLRKHNSSGNPLSSFIKVCCFVLVALALVWGLGVQRSNRRSSNKHGVTGSPKYGRLAARNNELIRPSSDDNEEKQCKLSLLWEIRLPHFPVLTMPTTHH